MQHESKRSRLPPAQPPGLLQLGGGGGRYTNKQNTDSWVSLSIQASILNVKDFNQGDLMLNMQLRLHNQCTLLFTVSLPFQLSCVSPSHTYYFSLSLSLSLSLSQSLSLSLSLSQSLSFVLPLSFSPKNRILETEASGIFFTASHRRPRTYHFLCSGAMVTYACR